MLPRLRRLYRSTLGHAVVGAAVFWASLPPWDLWPLAWVAPVWWVMLIRRRELDGPKRGRESFSRGDPGMGKTARMGKDSRPLFGTPAPNRPYGALWLAGFLFWLAALHYLRLPHWMTSFGWLALSFYLAFYLPVFVGLARVAVHRLRIPVIAAAPVVWMGLELVRGHMLTGFTMASLGHTQYRWLALIQLSDLAGAYGVSFVVMFVAACLGRMLPCEGKPATYRPLAPAGLVLAAALVYGHFRMSPPQEPSGPTRRIAMIQAAYDVTLDMGVAAHRQMHDDHRRLSDKAIEEYGPVDLIVWPESAFGGMLATHDPDLPLPDGWARDETMASRWDDPTGIEFWPVETRDGGYEWTVGTEMADMSRYFGSAMLMGASTRHATADGEKRFNSAVFVTPSGRRHEDRYDKMHLVMFGEYVPFSDDLYRLIKIRPLRSLGISTDPGESPTVYDLGGPDDDSEPLRVAPHICFESVIPHFIRGQVNTLARQGREPDVLINLTNDGWFRGSSELDMHLVCGVFRAVECRKPFLIAANTGFSAWIDGDGRIVDQGPRRAEGTILATVGRDPRESWYLRHGDWPAGLCLLTCLVFSAVGCRDRWVARRRAKRVREN